MDDSRGAMHTQPQPPVGNRPSSAVNPAGPAKQFLRDADHGSTVRTRQLPDGESGHHSLVLATSTVDEGSFGNFGLTTHNDPLGLL
jgi:hypothetical protein